MQVRSKLLVAGALASLTLTGACVTDPETGRQTISKTAIGGLGGAVGGYLLGDLVGGGATGPRRSWGQGSADSPAQRSATTWTVRSAIFAHALRAPTCR